MPTTKNILLPGAANKPISLDIFYNDGSWATEITP